MTFEKSNKEEKVLKQPEKQEIILVSSVSTIFFFSQVKNFSELKFYIFYFHGSVTLIESSIYRLAFMAVIDQLRTARTTGSKFVSYSSCLTGKEWVILQLCSLLYDNKDNLPY